jgi:hypothetical protein
LHNIGGFLCRKYKEAIKGVAESASAFDKLNETADPIMVATWEEQDRYAHSRRVTDPSAMDVFEVQLKRGEFLLPQQPPHKTDYIDQRQRGSNRS